MNDLNCWYKKFTPCVYSSDLISKINYINIHSINKVNVCQIKKAIYYAKKYHHNQKRDSGEPFYTHPIAVASKVAEHCFKTDILVTSILHDILEDTSLAKKELSVIFGEKIANQVYSLSKIKLNKKITIKDMLYGLYFDNHKELLMVKIFDRLHNMQTLESKQKKDIERITTETAILFIAASLLLSKINTAEELTELCLKFTIKDYNYLKEKAALTNETQLL